MDHTRKKKDSHNTATVYSLLSALVFLLLLYYAYIHTWEYDEAWTYLSVKKESLPDLITYKNFNIANNHLLNSLWFKLLQIAGIKNVIFYRGASLLCFFIYSYFLYKLVTYKAPFWSSRSDWYLTLFFLPPIAVYFASGRGYGMAAAFFCGSFYYLKVYLAENKSGAYWKFFFLGMLSSLAIVSFFFPFAAMLLYMYAKKYRDSSFRKQIIAKQDIISGILLLGLVLYIYHIGKTIILHDTIINGSDNLFANGMYSTFLSSLGLYDLFPFPNLYNKLYLGLVSKLLVLFTFIPVAWLIFRKYLLKYAEFSILIIMTLLFFFSHILLKSKYPSDRSVIYLLFLIYSPVILHIVRYRDKFFKLHYYTVLLIAALNFIGFFYVLTKPDLYSVMKEKPVKQYSILSDWPNWADTVNSDLYFNGRLKFDYLAKSFEKDMQLVDEKIRAAAADRQADFILLQKSSYLRNKQLFETGFLIEPVVSSGAKELYLIQRATK